MDGLIDKKNEWTDGRSETRTDGWKDRWMDRQKLPSRDSGQLLLLTLLLLLVVVVVVMVVWSLFYITSEYYLMLL